MYQYSAERVHDTNPRLNQETQILYETFVDIWGDVVDLTKPETIEAAYTTAKTLGVFDLAGYARKFYYAMALGTYGVVYISDACNENCSFCPAGHWNRNYKSRTMTDTEVVADVLCTMLEGHRRVCILQANWTEEAFMCCLERWLPEVIRTCGPLGLEEAILNVQTLTEESYRRIVEIRDGINPEVALQVRTFQETYDPEVYKCLIPPSKGGTKHDFARRRATQETAWKAGVNAVGLGVLFGLSPKPLRELDALVVHASELMEKGANVVRICLPSAHEAGDLQTRIPFAMDVESESYQQLSGLLYALARLAHPEVNWVMSERDPDWLRDLLATFASEGTALVKPGVRDNLDAYLHVAKGLHFVQTMTYAETSAEKYAKRMAQKGYQVDLDLSPERRNKIVDALQILGY